MESLPLVSILINNYNYGRFVGQAIDSALGQTYKNTEVIVVDDGSTDNSQEIIDNYGNQIISVFKENGGQASALNSGVAASKGEIICLLDADDIFLPEKVSKVVDAFNSHPICDWFFHESAPIKSQELVDKELQVIFDKISKTNSNDLPNYIDFRNNILNAQMPDFTPSTSNLCFSRRLSDKIFPLPEVKGFSGLAICDAYLKLLLVALGTGCATKINLGIFRVHDNNLYSTQGITEKRKINAEILLVTAYYMRLKLQNCSKLSNKLFSRGLGTYLRVKSNKLNYEKLIKDYLSTVKITEKTEIFLKASYYFIKLSFKNLV